MNSAHKIFALTVLLILLSVGFTFGEFYVWQDGTTAPYECVQKCEDNNIAFENTDGKKYVLSNECKHICFGTDTIDSNAAHIIEPIKKVVDNKNIEDTTNINEIKQQTKEQISDSNKAKTQKASEAQSDNKDNKHEDIDQNQESSKSDNYNEVKTKNEQDNKNIKNNVTSDQIINNNIQMQNNIDNYSKTNDSTQNLHPQNVTKNVQDQQIINLSESALMIKIDKNGQTEIVDEDGTTAIAHNAVAYEGKIKINKTIVEITPSQIKKKLRGELIDLRIVEYKGEINYQALALRKAKLFAIIDIQYRMTSNYNVQTGELTKSDKPIWTIFAFE